MLLGWILTITVSIGRETLMACSLTSVVYFNLSSLSDLVWQFGLFSLVYAIGFLIDFLFKVQGNQQIFIVSIVPYFSTIVDAATQAVGF